MARDVRQLRDEAATATASGKYKKALSAYLELERLEPRDAQWSKRAAETYRRIGKDKDAIGAYARAADRYGSSGFLVQAIAVCKLILQIEPGNDDALRRIAAMNEQLGTSPTRAVTMADHNTALAENPSVVALRTTGPYPAHGSERRRKVSSHPPVTQRTVTPQQLSAPGVPTGRTRTPSSGPVVAVARTKSKPVTLPPGQPIDSVSLKENVPSAFEREESSGVFVIPIDDETVEYVTEEPEEEELELRPSVPLIEVSDDAGGDTVDLEPSQLDDVSELDLADIEEIPLPEPRVLGAAAHRALQATPLFAGLPHQAFANLVEQLALVPLERGAVLFHEGDPGDALYVIVEGELAVQAEGPPRVEMGRLGPGAFIGEVALMTDQPRSATVAAVTDAELIRIDRVTLSNVLANHGEVLAAVLRFVRDRLVDRWTRTSPLFRPFGDSERAELAGRFRFLEIDSGTKLLGAGDRPDGLYIVLAGQFAVRRGGVTVATLGPGDLIGETALLAGGAFKSDVVARCKSLALCLPAADFRELIMTHPHVLEYIGEHAEHSRRLQIL
jgi:CRP-like cAMP-binding protein